MADIDYTLWPGQADVQERLTAAGLTLRTTTLDSRFSAVISAVITEVGSRTQRQFQPGAAGETRTYDGTGTAEMEVDEMISLTAVSVVGLQAAPGFPLSDAQLTSEQGRPQTRLTVSRGSLAAFGPAAVYNPVQSLFPAGRQNIQVTGQFGYAATIPCDLWDAACGEMALRLAQEALFNPQGRLIADKAGDEEKRYKLDDGTATGWHDLYTAALKFYKRPQGRRLRNQRNRMI